jgi:hypothetical protein
VDPAPEHVDAHAEGMAVELQHRHRVAYRPKRRVDEGESTSGFARAIG